MRRAVALTVAVLALAFAASATAETISLAAARHVADSVAYQRKAEQHGYGVQYGVKGCHRTGAHWARCRTYYTKFAGRYQGEYFECDFLTFVTNRSGRYEYATGRTACHRSTSA